MIEIKTASSQKREVNITEWTDEVKAFVKDLNVFERLVFEDQLNAYVSPDKSADERAEAGIAICLLALVGENGEPLFGPEYMEPLKKASFSPVTRVIQMLAEPGREDDSLKKG